MFVTKKQFREFIERFDFRHLFNQLGWNDLDESNPVKVGDQIFNLHSVAEKSGFRILVCSSDEQGKIPEYAVRLKLDRQVTRLFREHLIIFCDQKQQKQLWQLVRREPGKPAKLTETPWVKGQEPELLFQKTSSLFFTLDEEENITIVDVRERVTEHFHQNNEKVTKRFYERFKKEHKSFLVFIKGIEETANKEWYASLMLNRLMFCYFIQKKGFLDNNRNYLREKLNSCREKKGKNKFYSFYRDFLLALFHSGLGAPEHSKNLKAEIGRIPYLNGGLFDEHELEKAHKKIDIDDDAFESIFDFFDEFNWHLDTRETASGKDINPDVIGYIFEKYINERAKMGAYYTKEDITEYVSKNCIIPFLFDETKREYPKAFQANSEIWQLLKEFPDRYIYESVRKGAELELPQEIAVGLDTTKPGLLERRSEWNRTASEEFALPTEIWREVVERRTRYEELLAKLVAGEIKSVNDFITCNLNIRQFVQDVIERTNDPDFLRHFYKALSSVTIIDPTCGSGAFLFAAMNILEPLYEACLQRMRSFTEDEDRLNKENRKAFRHQYKFFRETLEEVQNPTLHPHEQYFIYKSIILRNLYGVDIMREAVEIAKLRLFLKLVATVDADYKKENLGLEPLPDVDFNIRSGNTLVGFATEAELKRGLDYTLDGVLAKPGIEEKCDIVARAFERYKEIQLRSGDDYKAFKEAKKELSKRLFDLNNELNQLLHKQYSGIKYDKWLITYQPFHWFAEFYEIMKTRRGFDIIIGNPPYVVYTPQSLDYQLKNYHTLSCANLYAFCIERSYQIMTSEARFGMIIPNSSISADKLTPLQKIITKNKHCWISNYAWRPAKLFEGANMLLAIAISSPNSKKEVLSTMYYKWYEDYRSCLFENISYQNATGLMIDGSIPKVPSALFFDINKKLFKNSRKTNILSHFQSSPSSNKFYYFRAVLYWVKILDKEPVFLENGENATTGEMKTVYTASENLKYILTSILSSSLYFVHYITWSSCQVINARDFEFPFDAETLSKDEQKKLVQLGSKLQEDLIEHSNIITRNYSTKGRVFTMQKQYFYIKKSKSIIDKIDNILAKHYNFTEEELDFIINYDIKYRMGKELEEDEE